MPKTIELQQQYNYPPEVIWSCLTEADILAAWLMENDFKPIVGHRFRFITKPKVKFGFDGIIYGEVLEVIHFRKLVYGWKGGPGNGKINLDTVITWTLEPTGGGTLLTLRHSGFKGLKNFIPFIVMGKGWQKIMQKKLVKYLNGVEHANIAG
ncbi:SRPBCC domain-containing protein [Pollutibacter soli]|uniref:SRPBCC family protein n=1 Tax=Pollutibacter soli TaxID=3034157 RepID=UPI0030136D8F